MRALLALVALVFVVLLVVAAVTGGKPSKVTTPTTSAGNVYSQDVLARASRMTQQMSVDGPVSGHEYHGHTDDSQLRLSSDPVFVGQLEAYQRQVDRMLARTP